MDKDIQREIDEIKDLARKGGDFSDKPSRAEAFASVFSAMQSVLEITPYDEQLMAAAALDDGKIAEMQTGEGKTFAAVFAAAYAAKCGHKVHLLTFNDYLAHRDFEWMKPVYDMVGVSVSCITSDMSVDERKKAYSAQVLYTTAREAGFDYLRDFVSESADGIVQPPLDYAIVDEADSIMIDEARIPLVIAAAGEYEKDSELDRALSAAKKLTDGDFEIDEENRSIYLTDKGIEAAEKLLKIDNLYDEENTDLLTRLNDCVKAVHYLKQDKDYIIKNGKISLIDDFTGRAAQNRHYPGFLHTAVELYNGLSPSGTGKILGTIALQFYLRRYNRLCGMTGTASSAEDEFYQLYDLKLEKIPTHRPCIRIDREPEVFTHAEAKWGAIIAAIKTAFDSGRPVLVGTESISQGQWLSERLSEKGIAHDVLNAKNDHLEAEIIKNAGDIGKITVSANMAGRGVDIKLGGFDEKNKAAVMEKGGLLVISAFMGESSRINQQLNGRAGRQGEPGESRMFVALDDEIFVTYDLKSLVSGRNYPKEKSLEPVQNAALLKEIKRIQRISQGDMLDDRKNLLKYTMIGEKHRDAVFSARTSLLNGERKAQVWEKTVPELFEKASKKFGRDKLEALEAKLLAAVMNDVWSDYLEFSTSLREGIHLVQVGGKSSAEEYNISCEEYYSQMSEQTEEIMAEYLEKIVKLSSLDDFKVPFPTEFWTYLLEDKSGDLLKKPFILNLFEEDMEKTPKLPVKKGGFFSNFFNKNK